MGQAFQLGQYAVHWHLHGDAPGQYLRGCSIHTSWNRGTTVHGTNFVSLQDNVAYNIMGGWWLTCLGVGVGVGALSLSSACC